VPSWRAGGARWGQTDGSGSWTTSYQRLNKAGAAETRLASIDTGKNTIGAFGVALSGHVLLVETLEVPKRQARWLDRDAHRNSSAPAGTICTRSC
jgi:hypothetical protein